MIIHIFQPLFLLKIKWYIKKCNKDKIIFSLILWTKLMNNSLQFRIINKKKILQKEQFWVQFKINNIKLIITIATVELIILEIRLMLMKKI